MELVQTSSRWSRYLVDFPTAHPTEYEKINTVRGEYYQPHGVERAPLVILSHGISDPSLIPARLLARALAKQGMACFVLHLLFHSSRMPKSVARRLHRLTADEWYQGYIVSVTDVRQVIDWASQRPEINSEQIAVFGLSFGGFISAIAMGIDPRVKAGAFIIAGGNGEKINHRSRRQALRRHHEHTEAEYQEIQRAYSLYQQEVAERGFAQVTPVRKHFQTDPLTFAPYLRERPVLMINALWDEYIPKEATLELWEASGRPEISWYPSTHSTIWLWFPLIRRRVTRFLRSNLGLDGGSAKS
jgi:dienelactone hydrolase